MDGEGVVEAEEIMGDSATVKVKLNNLETNVLMDSGARWSLIDLGSLSVLGMEQKIRNNDNDLVNASGDKMDIVGVVDIEVKCTGMEPVVQPFKVLNTKTFSNILLGRDFMRRFGSVTFDFQKNGVKIGKVWLKSLTVIGYE